MKKKVLVVSIFLGLLSLFSCTVFYYYENKGNTFEYGLLDDIEIVLESLVEGEKVTDSSNLSLSRLVPGDIVNKNMYINNVGSRTAFIRFKYNVSFDIVDDSRFDVDNELVVIELDEDYWTYNDDGYFYYNTKLNPGELSVPLFDKVSISKQMGDDYQNSTLLISVDVSAVQADNNGDSVFAAFGWP